MTKRAVKARADWTCEGRHAEHHVWLGRKPAQPPELVDCPGHPGGDGTAAVWDDLSLWGIPEQALWHMFKDCYPQKQGQWRTNGVPAHSSLTTTGRPKKLRKPWKLLRGNQYRGWKEYARDVGAPPYSARRLRADVRALGMDGLDLAGLKLALKDGRLKTDDLGRRYWKDLEPNTCWEPFTGPRSADPAEERTDGERWLFSSDDEADHAESKPIYAGKRTPSGQFNTMTPGAWHVGRVEEGWDWTCKDFPLKPVHRSCAWEATRITGIPAYVTESEWSTANWRCFVCWAELPEPYGKREVCGAPCRRKADAARKARKRRLAEGTRKYPRDIACPAWRTPTNPIRGCARR